jgi:hypothetical protein
VLISIGGVLIVGGIILLIVLILRKKRKNEKKRKNKQQLTESSQTNTTNQRKSETHYKPIVGVSQTETIKESKSASNIELANRHQIPFEDIEVGKELGKGSYGRVCLGRWNGAPVALKFCKEKESLDEFWKEANLMMYEIRIFSPSLEK